MTTRWSARIGCMAIALMSIVLGACQTDSGKQAVPGERDALVALLQKSLGSNEEEDVLWAIAIIGSMGIDGSLFAREVDALRGSSSPAVRSGIKYLDILQASEPPTVAGLRRLASGDDAWLACAAMICANKFGVAGASIWQMGLRNADARCRSLALRGLIDHGLVCGNLQMIEDLCLSGEHEGLQIEAASGILMECVEHQGAVAVLLRAVDDEEWGLFAIGRIASLGDEFPRLRAVLCPIVKRAAESGDSEVAYVAMTVMESWAREDAR